MPARCLPSRSFWIFARFAAITSDLLQSTRKRRQLISGILQRQDHSLATGGRQPFQRLHRGICAAGFTEQPAELSSVDASARLQVVQAEVLLFLCRSQIRQQRGNSSHRERPAMPDRWHNSGQNSDKNVQGTKIADQHRTAFSVSELKRWRGSLTFSDFAATLYVLPAVGRRSEVRAFDNRRTLYAMLIVHALPNYESAHAGGNAGTEPAR